MATKAGSIFYVVIKLNYTFISSDFIFRFRGKSFFILSDILISRLDLCYISSVDNSDKQISHNFRIRNFSFIIIDDSSSSSDIFLTQNSENLRLATKAQI